VVRENLESELKRLRKEQRTSLENEVFGGLSREERAEFNGKTKRINQLEIERTASTITQNSVQSAKAEQTRQWNKESETDTPQAGAHQPYRSREKDSADASNDSTKRRGKRKNEPDQKGSE
jgi:hypothetical protein